MFLLDTNVISELRKAHKADTHVSSWGTGQRPADLFISVITIMELRMGILSLARRDAPQAAVLESWLSRQVMPSFSGRVLAIDLAVANQCAALHVPDPRSDRDALIAATALVHGLTVVTRNTRDFEATGVLLLNPWL